MKIIPIPDCLPSDFILLAKQIEEEMIKAFAVPKYLLNPRILSTVEEILPNCGVWGLGS